MKRIIYILIIIHCSLLSLDAQWMSQFEPGHPITDIEFINRYTGWACGNARIYKTTNGGGNWIMQPNPAQSLIMQIHPVNENVVYAAGWWTFMKTTNGGENWSAIFTGGPGSGLPQLEGLYFINENTGWLCGNVVVMKTTDGGNTFTDSMRIGVDAQDIYFRNETEGVISAMTGAICRTSNGGANWEIKTITGNGPMYNFIRLSFIYDQYGWVGGEVVFKTTDFGLTWDSIGAASYPGNQAAYCIKFTSMNTGFTGGTFGYMYKTTDGGHTWFEENTSGLNTGFIRDFYAYNDSIIWAGCGRMILYTTTGGYVFVNQVSSEIPEGFTLYQNYPNPFNSTTAIKFEIKERDKYTMQIYDMLGRKVDEVFVEEKSPGTYKVTYDASNLSSGVYIYSLKNSRNSILKKLTLIK